MIPFRRILMPVDYSKTCQALVPHVRSMAEHFQASLTLVHASEPPAVLYGELAMVDPRWPQMMDRERERLAKFAAEAFPGRDVVTIFEEGGPAEAIREVVKREGIDLVMLPTKGRGPVRRFLLGSIATKVLHDVECAVWTEVHERLEGHEPVFPYRSILCPIGWSEEATAVVSAGAVLARSFGAKLTLLHAVELPPPSMELDMTPYRERIGVATREFLARIQREAGVTAETRVVNGNLTAFVREEAERCGADLVLTGRGHAHGALSSLWSRLYGIVREAPCPVLSI